MTKDIQIDKMDDRKPSVEIRFTNKQNDDNIQAPAFEVVNNQHVVGAEKEVYLRVEVDDAEGASNFTVTVPNFANSTVQPIPGNNHYLVILKYTFDDINTALFPYNSVTNDLVNIQVQQNSSNYRTQISQFKSINIPIKKMDTLAPAILGFYPNRGADTRPDYGGSIDIAATDGAVEEVILTVIIFDRFGDKIGDPHSLDIFGVVGEGDANKIEITSSKLGLVTKAELESTAKME